MLVNAFGKRGFRVTLHAGGPQKNRNVSHPIPSPDMLRQTLLSYTLAVISTAAAGWIRMLLDPLLGNHQPYATFVVAVMVTAWYGGFGPSMAALALGLLSSMYFFIPPRVSLQVADLSYAVGIATFLSVAVFGALLIRSQRSAQLRAEEGVFEAFKKQRELELEIIERQQAEDAVRQSEARIRAVLDNAFDAVIGMDGDGVIDDWNPQAEFIFGWTRREAVGRRFSEMIIPPRHREALMRGLQRFLKTGESRDLNRRVEITALARDASEFPVELAISPLQAGASYRFNAFIADITDRKRVEQELRDSEKRYRSLALAITSIVWTTNAGGEFVDAQRSWEAYTGQSRDEYTGLGWLRALHPDDRERIKEIWIKALAERTAYESEGRIWCATTKEYHHFVARGVPLVHSNASVREWVGTITDVNDRKRSEHALQESQARLVEAQRIGRVGSWEMDFRGSTILWSEETYRIFGCDPETFTPTREAVFACCLPTSGRPCVRGWKKPSAPAPSTWSTVFSGWTARNVSSWNGAKRSAMNRERPSRWSGPYRTLPNCIGRRKTFAN